MKEIVHKTKNMVQKAFSENEGSHDWHHIERVRRMALHLMQSEGGNRFIIEMSALLHDLEDWKITHENTDNQKVKSWIHSFKIPHQICDDIVQVINEVSYKGAGVSTPCSSIESMIVQDADRLDAMGAIGIARAFAFGGSKGHPLFLPHKEIVLHESFEHYKKKQTSTLHHFYEKLLLLKERMNTNTARKIAGERHRFMLTFIDEFKKEWEF